MARAATKMKRREFIKVGLGAAALASMPSRTGRLSQSAGDGESTPVSALPGLSPALAPRRSELLDFDWRFKPMPTPELRDPVALSKWVWPQTGDHSRNRFLRRVVLGVTEADGGQGVGTATLTAEGLPSSTVLYRPLPSSPAPPPIWRA